MVYLLENDVKVSQNQIRLVAKPPKNDDIPLHPKTNIKTSENNEPDVKTIHKINDQAPLSVTQLVLD